MQLGVSRGPASPDWAALPTLIAAVLLATAVSAPVRMGWIDPAPGLVLVGVPVLRALLEGLGPLLVALLLLWRAPLARRPMSLAGRRPWQALGMAAVVPPAFAIAGAFNGQAAGAALVGATTLVYCLMEESAWRGVLFNRLSGWRSTPRALAIGAGWYLWHLSFLAPDATWTRELAVLAALLGGSLLLDRLAERTGAVMTVACAHLLVNVLAFNTLAAILSPGQRLGVALLCVIAWGWLLRRRTRPAVA